MSVDYKIIFESACNQKSKFDNYVNELAVAVQDINKAINNLQSLDSFQGQAAESIKRYFTEVHANYLSNLLMQVAEGVAHLYAVGFYTPLDEQEADGIKDARIYKDVLSSLCKSYSAIKDGSLWSAQCYVDRARRSLPSDVAVSLPSGESAANTIDNLTQVISTCKKSVQDIDDAGHQSMSSTDVEALRSALSAAISSWAEGKHTPSSYESGEFSSTVDLQNIKAHSLQVQKFESENADTILAANKSCIDYKRAFVEEDRAEAAKKKMFWAGLGEIGVGLQIIGALVTLAAASTPVGLVVGLVSVTLLATDLVERDIRQNKMYQGNYGADLSESAKETRKNIKDFNSVVKNNGKFAEYGGMFASNKQFGKGVVKSTELIADKATDVVFDEFGKQTGLEDSTEYNTLKPFLEESAKQIGKREFDGAGLLSVVGEGMTVLGDAKAEEADKVIEECDEELDALKDAEKRAQNYQVNQYAVAW